MACFLFIKVATKDNLQSPMATTFMLDAKAQGVKFSGQLQDYMNLEAIKTT